jgi:hypothetical protein
LGSPTHVEETSGLSLLSEQVPALAGVLGVRTIALEFPAFERVDLVDAEGRGDQFRELVWSSPEMLNSADAATRVGEATFEEMRDSDSVLGLQIQGQPTRFPAWQFEPSVLPHLRPVFSILPLKDGWARYLFLVQREPLLGGVSPLEALRAGRVEDVLHVARMLATELASP